MISCEGSIAGCWLDAIPSSQDYTLSNAEFAWLLLLQLGAALLALRDIRPVHTRPEWIAIGSRFDRDPADRDPIAIRSGSDRGSERPHCTLKTIPPPHFAIT